MVKQQGATIQRQTFRVTQTEMYAMRQWFSEGNLVLKVPGFLLAHQHTKSRIFTYTFRNSEQ